MFIRHAVLALSATLVFGPPSVKVEIVKNPATAKVKGAVFMITGHHHQDTLGFTVVGRAEGIVAGKRVTRPITLTSAGSEGVYGVKPQWTAGQPWVLVFTVSEGGHDEHGLAEAVVRIASDGSVKGIDYPMGKLNDYPWPRKIEAKEIDAALVALGRP